MRRAHGQAQVFGPRDVIQPDFPPVPAKLQLKDPNAESNSSRLPLRPPRLDPDHTVVFSSELDGICPGKLIGAYCERTGVPFEMMHGFEQ